jgi:hypothetical protein
MTIAPSMLMFMLMEYMASAFEINRKMWQLDANTVCQLTSISICFHLLSLSTKNPSKAVIEKR